MKIVGMFAGEHSSLEPSSNSACQTFASVEIVAGKRQTNFNKDPYARIVLKIDPSAHAIVKESSGMTSDYSIARRLVNRKQFADCTISLSLSIFILVLFPGPRVFETLSCAAALRSDFHTDIGRKKRKGDPNIASVDEAFHHPRDLVSLDFQATRTLTRCTKRMD